MLKSNTSGRDQPIVTGIRRNVKIRTNALNGAGKKLAANLFDDALYQVIVPILLKLDL